MPRLSTDVNWTPTGIVGRTAGRAIGRRAAARRGSVLLMVIGVLALLAIITVAYTTLGRADRTTSAALTRTQRLDDQSRAVADYIARVIGRDVTLGYVEAHLGNQAVGIRRRELWDYPWTDPNMVSVIPPESQGFTREQSTYEYLFNPAGGFDEALETNFAFVDPRRPSDPFLASTEPTYVVRDLAPSQLPAPEREYQAWRDWPQISVLSPDGRFVNLANLRNNFAAGSGFAARTDSLPYTSDRLSLFDPETGDMQTAAPIGQDPDRDIAGIVRADGLAPRLNRPHDWAVDQVWAFRGLEDLVGDDSGTSAPAPQDPEYVPNQFADADGDGFIDSRWFEMIDASRSRLDEPRTVSLLSGDGRVRWFIASRVMDLSGLLNVNIARDFQGEPGLDGTGIVPPPNLGASTFSTRLPALAGQTPADADLWRLLQRSDFTTRFESPYRDALVGPNPAPGDPRAGEPGDYTDFEAPMAGNVARAAYQSLIYGVENPGAGALFSDITFAAGGNAQTFEADRLRLFQDQSLSSTGNREVVLPSSDRVRVDAARFGIEDQLELLTYYGVNDPENTSRLELTLDGRLENSEQFGPLRSNRPLDLELGGRAEARTSDDYTEDDRTNSYAGPLYSWHSDIRRLLTTVSGARRLAGDDLSIVPSVAYAPDVADQPVNPLPSLRLTEQPVDLARLRADLAGTTPTTAQLAEITNQAFRAYASALMPYAFDVSGVGFPNAWDPSDPFSRFLSYGGRAEIAMRIAAHLAANLVDSLDSPSPASGANDNPTKISLELFPGTIAAVSAADPENNPFDGAQITLDPRQLPRSESNLTTAGGLPRSAVNIFGIDPQPFIVEVTSYVMLTDTPSRAVVPGDDEYLDRRVDIVNGIPTEVFAPITIDPAVSPRDGGIIDSGQPDFLGEVLAFQLHNPFPVQIQLATKVNDVVNVVYYLEYAGRFFGLAPRDPDTTLGQPDRFDSDTPESLVLGPFETRTFYTTNPRDPEAFALRVRNAAEASPQNSATIDLDFITEWAQAQFGPTCVHIPLIDPTSASGGEVPGDSTVTPFGGRGSMVMNDLHGHTRITLPNDDNTVLDVADDSQRRVVYLWRAVDVQDGDNDPADDYLADRLRDPDTSGSGTLSKPREIGTGDNEIDGTEAGRDAPGAAETEFLDNSGYTFTSWSSISRPSADTDALAAIGVLPPWTLEVKPGDSRTSINTERFEEPRVGNEGDYGPDLVTSVFPRARTLSLWKTEQTGVGPKVNPTMGVVGSARVGSGETDILTALTALQSRVYDPASTGGYRPINSYLDIAPILPGAEPSSGGSSVRSNAWLYSRAADALLPMAIGPWQEPLAATSVTDRVARLEAEWTTLAEALALGCGLSSEAADADNLWHNAGLLNPSGPLPGGVQPLFDRGRLRLDAFVPFINVNPADDTFDVWIDIPLGNGTPLAWNVLERFRTGPGRDAAGLLGADNSPGALTQFVPGLININTAPLDVLRTLPLLAPFNSTSQTTWLSGDRLGLSSGDFSSSSLFDPSADTFDIAATLVASRDRTRLTSRPPEGGGQGARIDFFDESRAELTGIQALRGGDVLPGQRLERGFRSIGEILGLDVRGVSADPDNSIFRLGYDGLSNNANALNSFNVATPADPNTRVSDTQPDDYAERLAIAAALSNTVSVRSDVFAVWFLMHGYTEADTKVADGQAMTPTVRRRFVMVLDRSNVTRETDTPRVLLLQEVPIR